MVGRGVNLSHSLILIILWSLSESVIRVLTHWYER